MPFLRSRFALLLISCVLAACNTSTPVTPNPPAEPDLTALVVGEADSPFLTALKEKVRFVQDDGSQPVGGFDLLVLDGDAHTPAALAELPQVDEALARGRWVLVADATTAQKEEGVAPRLGFSTKGDTDAFLFREMPGTVMPTYDVLEMPLPTAGTSDAPLPEQEQARYGKFADRVVAKLGGTTATQQAGGCAAPLDIQAGIIYATWCYSNPNDWSIDSVSDIEGNTLSAGDTFEGYTVTAQPGQNDATFTFTLLLNNADVVTGDSQTLHVATVGQMTPATINWPNGIADYLDGQPYLMGGWFGLDSEDNVIAYPQSELEINVGPNGDNASLLQPAAIFAPQAPNNTTTESYSSSTSFSIGATLNGSLLPTGPSGGGGVKGSYSTTSTNTTSRTITDWTWTAEATDDNSYGWDFTSTNPPVGGGTPTTPGNLGSEWDSAWLGNRNLLNDSLMQYSTEAVWTTEGLTSETVDFEVSSQQHLPSLGFILEIPFLTSETQMPAQRTVSLDLGTVIPVTLVTDSLTFTDSDGNPVTQDNPVSAGEDVTGTVTLSGPAPFSYTITSTATSLNDNAVITESPLRITKGETSKTFTIETNANGLDVFNETVAVDVFLGSFGSQAAQQLWISNELR